MATQDREINEKKSEEVRKTIEEQEVRLQNLQSTGFQLANYYFVFQGVILTASCNGNTSLKREDRWFLFTVSLLAAVLNLVALLIIGLKYIKTIEQQDENWCLSNEIARRGEQHNPTSNNPDSTHNNPSEEIQGVNPNPSGEIQLTDSTSPINPSRESQRVNHNITDSTSLNNQSKKIPCVDPIKKIKRVVSFCVCMVIFISFAAVTLYGCWSFVCKQDKSEIQSYQTTGGRGSYSKCIRFCNGGTGSSCLRICNEY